jgi:hypothetical protein
LICAGDPSLDAVAAWNGQCNMMLVRREWLMAAQPELEKLRNCSKGKAVQAEGWLWHAAPTKAVYPNSRYGNIADPEPIYGGASRVTEFYDAVAIKKFKANWVTSSEEGYAKRL